MLRARDAEDDMEFLEEKIEFLTKSLSNTEALSGEAAFKHADAERRIARICNAFKDDIEEVVTPSRTSATWRGHIRYFKEVVAQPDQLDQPAQVAEPMSED